MTKDLDYSAVGLAGLLEIAARKDESAQAAFGEVYERAKDPIVEKLKSRGLHNREDREDIYNVTMLSAWKSCGKFQDGGCTDDNALNWLITIAIRRHLDFLASEYGSKDYSRGPKTAHARIRTGEAFDIYTEDNPARDESPGESAEREERSIIFYSAIAELTPEQKYVMSILPRSAMQQTFADLEGIKPKTFGSQRHQAFRKLRGHRRLQHAMGYEPA